MSKKTAPLSRIVAYRNHLLRIDAAVGKAAAIKLPAEILQTVSDSSIQVAGYVDELSKQFQTISDDCDKFYDGLKRLIAQLNVMIAGKEPAYFANSTEVYLQEVQAHIAGHITNDQMLERKKQTLPAEADRVFHVRLAMRTASQYPGLIIRPGTEYWIKDMVANDPLYIADLNKELLSPWLDEFTPEYQRRLRVHEIAEVLGEPIFTSMPMEQIGICLAYSFFNHRPIELIQRYLTEIFPLLRPGGVLLMTYNECDHEEGVDLAERTFNSYTPGHLLREIMVDIGYQITFQWSLRAFAWIELTKPGDLTSLRAGQTLARIFPI